MTFRASLAAAFLAGATLAASAPPALAQIAVVKRIPGHFVILDYAAPVPAVWKAETPASNYRAGQYRVPAAKGAADGELVVFYFGKGKGGSVAANAERWVSQFTTADGKPVAPKLGTTSVAGMPVTTVELNGSYSRGVGMGPQGEAKPNQTLLVAVIETPDGNVTIQLHGDRATVAQHRKAFEAMVRGFRKTSAG